MKHINRRNFLQTAAAVAATGAATTTAAYNPRTRAQEQTREHGAELAVNDYFTLHNSRKGNDAVQQSVWKSEEKYGWTIDSGPAGVGVNYPSVIVETSDFPLKRNAVEEFVYDIHTTSRIEGGEWNFAERWQLIDNNMSRTHEVILLLNWNSNHSHGAVVDEAAWTDQYGNTVDLWAHYDGPRAQVPIYLFRIQGQHDGGKIDMAEITKYLNRQGVSENLYINGTRIGNRYWPGCAGKTTIDSFNVTINGNTYESGISVDTTSVNEVRIKNVNTGKFLDVNVSGMENGDNVIQSNYEDTRSQRWKIINNSNGTVRIQNAASGLVLDPIGTAGEAGDNVVQWQYNGSENQQWRMHNEADEVWFENAKSSAVLDVQGGSQETGANIQLWNWHGGDNERWLLIDS